MFKAQEALTKAADEGILQDSEWAQVFPSMLERLEHNVFNEFPIPSSAPPHSLVAAPAVTTADEGNSGQQQDAAPLQEPDQVQDTGAAVIPPPLKATYQYVRQTLTSQFTKYPPHTIQRLSELLLYPKQHHRFLHAYLNALDRVISVYSGLNSLPPLTDDPPPATSELLANGVHLPPAVSPANAFGSDESLGGALLTPIPWLRDTAAEGSSSPAAAPLAPDSETTSTTGSPVLTPDTSSSDTSTPAERPDGALTQGELLRQEQQAGAAPAQVASIAPADEPHARGPEAIGMEDTGPQARAPGAPVLDMEAAVGRGHGHAARPAAEAAAESERPRADADADADGDVELVDVDGAPAGADDAAE